MYKNYNGEGEGGLMLFLQIFYNNTQVSQSKTSSANQVTSGINTMLQVPSFNARNNIYWCIIATTPIKKKPKESIYSKVLLINNKEKLFYTKGNW